MTVMTNHEFVPDFLVSFHNLKSNYRFTLMYGRSQHNIVTQLTSN